MASIHDPDREIHGGPLAQTAEIQLKKGSSLDMLERGRRWERCQVSAVFPETHTCNVTTDQGARHEGVGWPGGPGEIAPPEVGAFMYVHLEGGTPALVNAPPQVQFPPLPQDSVSFLPGVGASVKIPTAQIGTFTNQPRQSGSKPTDVLPGDYIRHSPTGNYVGVLNGGVNIMRSGEFAQVQTIADRDTGDEIVNIVGRAIRMFSGAGVLNFTTVPSRDKNGKAVQGRGKTSMIFTIGADEETESSPNEEFFRVRMALGHDGNLANLRITDAKGHTSYSSQIFPTGDTEVVQRSETRRVDLGWAVLSESFNLGARAGGSISTDENLSIRAGGTFSARAFGRMSLRAVGGNASLRSNRSVSINSGSTLGITANGPLIPTPLSRSMDIVAKNGSVVFDIGNQITGELPTAFSGFRVSVSPLGGSIRLSAPSPAGGISIDSPIVKIGGLSPPYPAPVVPVVPATLSAPLLSLLGAMAFLFDGHVHAIPEGLSGPVIAPPVSGPPTQAGTLGVWGPLIPSKTVSFGA